MEDFKEQVSIAPGAKVQFELHYQGSEVEEAGGPTSTGPPEARAVAKHLEGEPSRLELGPHLCSRSSSLIGVPRHLTLLGTGWCVWPGVTLGLEEGSATNTSQGWLISLFAVSISYVAAVANDCTQGAYDNRDVFLHSSGGTGLKSRCWQGSWGGSVPCCFRGLEAGGIFLELEASVAHIILTHVSLLMSTSSSECLKCPSALVRIFVMDFGPTV